jgi:hypothetical protein
VTNWGEIFYDHYVSHFRDPVGRAIVQHQDVPGVLQVLVFKGVLPDRLLFASLGLSRYAYAVKTRAEVVLAADQGFDDVPGILSEVLYHLVASQRELQPGIAVGGLPEVSPAFAQTYDKEALYLSAPRGLPEAALTVRSPQGEEARLLMGSFLSAREFDFHGEKGAQELEQLFQARAVDLSAVGRPSVL